MVTDSQGPSLLQGRLFPPLPPPAARRAAARGASRGSAPAVSARARGRAPALSRATMRAYPLSSARFRMMAPIMLQPQATADEGRHGGLRDRFERRNEAPLTLAPDLDPAGAGEAAKAGGEGEGEGRWRRRVRELGERGRRRGEEREGGGEEGEGEGESRVGVREGGFANVPHAVNFSFFGLN